MNCFTIITRMSTPGLHVLKRELYILSLHLGQPLIMGSVTDICIYQGWPLLLSSHKHFRKSWRIWDESITHSAFNFVWTQYKGPITCWHLCYCHVCDLKTESTDCILHLPSFHSSKSICSAIPAATGDATRHDDVLPSSFSGKKKNWDIALDSVVV